MKTKKRRGTKGFSGAIEDAHWLGEGLAGQESLVDELDPYLYAADSAVCRAISQLSHRWRDRRERSFAALVLGSQQVPWLLGYTAQRFDCVAVTDDDDPLLEDVANRFSVALLGTDELDTKLQRGIDLLIFTEPFDGGVADSAAELQRFMPYLSERARVLFTVRLREENGVLAFTTGEPFERFEVAAKKLQFSLAEEGIERIALLQVGARPHFGVEDFVKRHGEFFGKNLRDLSLFRMYREDFHDLIVGPGAAGREVGVVHLQSEYEMEKYE